MTAAKVTEVSRGSAHRRQVAYVRASLHWNYCRAASPLMRV